MSTFPSTNNRSLLLLLRNKVSRGYCVFYNNLGINQETPCANNKIVSSTKTVSISENEHYQVRKFHVANMQLQCQSPNLVDIWQSRESEKQCEREHIIKIRMYF